MGGIGKLFGGSSTTTTTSQPYTGAMYDTFMNFGPYLRDQIGNTAQYSGPYSAPMNSTQQQALGMFSNNANSQFLKDTINGNYLNPESNPYLKGYADQIREDLSKDFGTKQDQVNTTFNNRSFYDGSQRQKALNTQLSDYTKNEANAMNNLYGNAYNQERSNQFTAQNALNSAANSLMNAGNTAYNIADQDVLRRYEDYWKQQGLTTDQVNQYLQWLSLGRNPSSTSTSNDGGAGFGNFAGQIGAAFIACFAAGTKVDTLGEGRPIEKIEINEVVIGLNDNNEICAEKVTNTEHNKQKAVIVKAGEYQVTTTSTQPFLTPDGLKDITELTAGDKVITRDGEAVIESIEYTDEEIVVYDITTEGRNIVFANGFAVEGGF